MYICTNKYNYRRTKPRHRVGCVSALKEGRKVFEGREKGLMSVEKAISRVRPILLNEKKAVLIADKLNGSSLQDIAKANNTTVRSANNVNLKNSSLSGVGTSLPHAQASSHCLQKQCPRT